MARKKARKTSPRISGAQAVGRAIEVLCAVAKCQRSGATLAKMTSVTEGSLAILSSLPDAEVDAVIAAHGAYEPRRTGSNREDYPQDHLQLVEAAADQNLLKVRTSDTGLRHAFLKSVPMV
jgi:hypothetical protein